MPTVTEEEEREKEQGRKGRRGEEVCKWVEVLGRFMGGWDDRISSKKSTHSGSCSAWKTRGKSTSREEDIYFERDTSKNSGSHRKMGSTHLKSPLFYFNLYTTLHILRTISFINIL